MNAHRVTVPRAVPRGLRLSLLVLLAGAVLYAQTAAPPTEPPRLVVMVVLDGFRADALSTFSSHWRRGMKTLITEGANFRRVQIPYLTTDTCSGHFTISTGTLPYEHGMVVDDWYDRDLRKQVECTDDESARAVTYGADAKAGNSAVNLKVPTLADRLRDERPGARVVTLSIKARGAIGLAGHGGTAVTWFDDGAGSFVTSSVYARAQVPAVKQFFEQSPYQRDLDAAWTLRDAEAAYRSHDAALGERPPAGWDGLFPHVLKGVKGADGQYVTQWQRSGFANAYLGRFAVSMIDLYQLGKGQTIDYLGISFTGTDRVGHAFGPDSREYEDAAARLDDVLGDLIAALDRAVGRQRYVLALTADHGTTSVPQVTPGAGRVVNEDVRERIEDTLRTRYGAADGGSHVEWSVWGGYALRAATRARLEADPATVRAVQEAVQAIPGVQRLLYTPTLSRESKDALERMAALSGANTRRGEFVLTVQRNWVYTVRNGADATHHNTGQDYNQRVPLILLGGAIRAGAYDALTSPIDIAPTLASLVGVTLPAAHGRVLTEALQPRH